MKSSNQRKIDNIELVETYNITFALRRMDNAPNYNSDRCKRALIHAIAMAGVFGNEERKNLRISLNVP